MQFSAVSSDKVGPVDECFDKGRTRLRQKCSDWIRVIDPTVFVVKPEDVTPTFPEPVTLSVKAQTDPDTQLTYRWYHYDDDDKLSCPDRWCPVLHVGNKTHITSDNGSSLTILNTGRGDLGRYRCVADNGVNNDTFEVKLVTPPGLGNLTSIFVVTTTTLHPFNGPLSGTTRVSQYQKGKTNLDSTEARDNEWQWHQLGRMEVGTSLQRDNHASTPPLSYGNTFLKLLN